LKFGKLVKLAYLNCSANQLKELDLTTCPNLKTLYCGGNFLTDLNLSHNLQLEELSIANNNFLEQDLSFLEKLVNLKEKAKTRLLKVFSKTTINF
jgi:Leucine-rich repeat (LRR) protein